VHSIEKQVRDVMHKAFWDALEAKLSQDPPDFSHALILIQEVKEVCHWRFSQIVQNRYTIVEKTKV
jgi:hypothetical protein